MEFQRSAKKSRNQINITPLIDVVFLLVVFFMLTSKFVSYEAIELSVQSDDGYDELPSKQDEKPIHIIVMGEDSYSINGRGFTKINLKTYLFPRIRYNADRQIIIEPTPNTSIQPMVFAIDQVRLLGGKNLSLVEGK